MGRVPGSQRGTHAPCMHTPMSKRTEPDWDQWTQTMLAAVDLLDAVEDNEAEVPKQVRKAAARFRKVFGRMAAR